MDGLYYVLAAFAAALLVSAAAGPAVIRKLRKLKFGQKILEIGPKWHLNKQNLPTLGGIIFMLGIAAALLATLPFTGRGGDARWIISVAMAITFGAIGLLDDMRKIRKSRNKGLGALQKFMLQLAVAVVFITYMRIYGVVSNDLVFPFFNAVWHLSWIVYYVFMAFALVAMVNAVNLTDGIDGLAGSVTFAVMAFYAAVSFYLYNLTGELGTLKLSVLAASAAGGLIGFLIYNFNPAKVFMGDTGSLFLGGLVAALAFSIDLPLIMIPIGIIYIIETLSDVLQVGYFKLTHGKRIFKMAPIHHHFEMCGYSERQITITSFLITAAMCVLSYFGVIWLY